MEAHEEADPQAHDPMRVYRRQGVDGPDVIEQIEMDTLVGVDEPPPLLPAVTTPFARTIARQRLFIKLAELSPQWAMVGMMPKKDARAFERNFRQSAYYWSALYAPWLTSQFRFRTSEATPTNHYDLWISLQELPEAKARARCAKFGFDYDTKAPYEGWEVWSAVDQKSVRWDQVWLEVNIPLLKEGKRVIYRRLVTNEGRPVKFTADPETPPEVEAKIRALQAESLARYEAKIARREAKASTTKSSGRKK